MTAQIDKAHTNRSSRDGRLHLCVPNRLDAERAPELARQATTPGPIGGARGERAFPSVDWAQPGGTRSKSKLFGFRGGDPKESATHSCRNWEALMTASRRKSPNVTVAAGA